LLLSEYMKYRLFRFWLLIGLVNIFISFELAMAGDRYDILVNNDNSGTDQLSPRVAVGSSGQFAVIWADKRAGQSDIYCQYFDSAGFTIGSNQLINDDNLSIPQFEPAMSGNGSGQFGAVWKDYRNGSYPFHPDIYSSIKDGDLWQLNRNITSELPDSTCESPDIALFANGSSIIVWSDYRNRNWDIYGQRIGVNGEPIGSNFKINNESGTYAQHTPRVAAFPDGGFVVVWYDNRSGHDDIYGQRYDASFTQLGTNLKLSDDPGTSRQAFPSVATDGSRRFFVTWVDWRNGTYPANPDIFMRRFDTAGVPIGSSRQININDGGRSQKEAAICADWMGNICVVWADSSNGQWDCYGQIIDYQGKLSGGPFAIHQLLTGRQLQPDVETDGYKLFLVWSDSRSGNFDIYASIKQYNDPSLISKPNNLTFQMEQDGVLPAEQHIDLSNAGFGELQWQAIPDAEWIAVSPSSGSTPNGFAVAIGNGSLTYGDYFGQIRLIDLNHNDSSGVVPVRLSVTAPLLQVTPDTISFRVFAALGNPISQRFQVNNAGTGSLSWIAEENGIWMSLAETTGIASDYCTVNIEIGGLTYGDYYEPVVFISEDAVNSPETAWVHLELVGNMPYIAAYPDSLEFAGYVGTTFSGAITVMNLGAGMLNWSLINAESQLIPDRVAGDDNDTINFQLSTYSMNSGQYQFEFNILDTSSFNRQITVPVTLTLFPNDTIEFQDVIVAPGDIFKIPVNLTLSEYCRGGYIPFGFDSSMIFLDSVIFITDSLPQFVICQKNVLEDGGDMGFRANQSDSSISPGTYHLADIHMTARLKEGLISLDTMSLDSGGVYILDSAGNKKNPFIKPGNIRIEAHTDVNNGHSAGTPDNIILRQNSPNPFNGSTKITIELPRSTKVNLIVYNILGQEIRHLYDGLMPGGSNRLLWDGSLNDGGSAPSGIYFCRLSSDNLIQVKKMILLK
jgi:hypothetical protein